MANQSVLIGWLDLREEDQKMARDYISALRTEGTVDELGFGILRDAFANQFFPATNTIMTRTRYLIFLPAMYLKIEERQVRSHLVEKVAREMEDQIRSTLSKTERGGVIGAEAGKNIQRLPSTIYWRALLELGIHRHRCSQGYYHCHLDDLYTARKSTKDDDGLSHLSGPDLKSWDSEIKQMFLEGQSVIWKDNKIAPGTTFELTRAEAKYLKKKFDGLASKQPSLIDHLLGLPEVAEFRYPWDAPCPDSLKPAVAHARMLSMLSKGATLQYYDMLLEKCRQTDLPDGSHDMADAFSLWWDRTHGDLARWNIEEFFIQASAMNAIRGNDSAFLRQYLHACIEARDGESLLRSPSVRNLIAQREWYKKRHKSRLRQIEYLKRWTPVSPERMGSGDSDSIRYWLNYRSNIGRTFVQDIVTGLRGKK